MERHFGTMIAIKVVVVCVLITLARGLTECIRSMPFHRYP